MVKGESNGQERTASEGELSERRWMRASANIQSCPGQAFFSRKMRGIPPTHLE